MAALYSFSLAPNPRWTRLYPLQPEIKDYLRRCANGFAITEYIRFGHDALDAAWADGTPIWRVTTLQAVVEAQFLVGAIGPFIPNTTELGLSPAVTTRPLSLSDGTGAFADAIAACFEDHVR